MAEAKSIETTLIKISVRTLWFMAAGLVIAVFYAAMLYNGIMKGQNDIMQAVKDQGKDVQYQIQDVRKDVSGLQEDMKIVKQSIK